MTKQSGTRKVTAQAGRWILIGFVVIAGFFLIGEHRAHLYGALPFLLLGGCLLMHLLHRGHGRDADGDGDRHAGHEHGGRS